MTNKIDNLGDRWSLIDRLRAMRSDAIILNWFSTKRLFATSLNLGGITTALPRSPAQLVGFVAPVI